MAVRHVLSVAALRRIEGEAAVGKGAPTRVRADHIRRRLGLAMVFALTISLSPIAVLPAEAAPGRWFLTSPMKVSRWQLTLTTLQNGKILAVGGSTRDDPSGLTATAELYDPATRSWTLTGSMSVRRSGHAATLLNNGQILITGGTYTSGPWADTAELYDPTTGTFSLTGAMARGRAQHTATLLLDGRVLVAGSACEGFVCGTSPRAELYDPATGTFSPTGDMNVGRVGHVAVRLLNGKVLAAGGSGFTPSDLYDPATGRWSVTGDLVPARGAFAGVLLPNGKVFVAGGRDQTPGTTGLAPLASAKFYDPATGSWSATPDMPVARSDFDMAVQTNGYVVVTGGTTTGANSLAAYDLLHGGDGGVPDVGNATWTSGPPINRARTHHRMVPLGHKAMLAGGFNYDASAPEPSAETLGLEPGQILVTNTNDAGPGSLRAALEAANSDGVVSRILFNIPTSDPGFNGQWFTIRRDFRQYLLTASGVTIDGTSQTGFTGDTNALGPEVFVDGGSVALGKPGFVIGGDRNVLQGLTISGFPSSAVAISSGMRVNVVRGNYIGTDPTGRSAVPNGLSGCCPAVIDQGVGTVIGGTRAGDGNLISGNLRPGIGLAVGSRSAIVQGNRIGTDATGTVAIPNGAGILIGGFGVGGDAFDSLIGGTVSGSGNLISGNLGGAIFVSGSGHRIQGNFIGTNAAGTAAVPNGGTGIESGASATLIGGTSTGARNVISGNRGGIFLTTRSATHVIQGNYIGTDISGSYAIPNGGGIGSKVSDPDRIPSDHVIGGSDPGAGNLISGNLGTGIHLQGARYRVEGNLIGTDATGRGALPNGAHGIQVGPHGSLAGLNVVTHNTIAFNLMAGVLYPTPFNDPAGSPGSMTITQNTIVSNGGLGIDLAPGGVEGVTPNDPGDADTGPNGLQNFPVITAAHLTPQGVRVVGRIDTASPATVTIEFFANRVPAPGGDPSGYGEGAEFLGSGQPTADGSFSFDLPSVPPGTLISATATDAAGNTSEFARNHGVRGLPASEDECKDGGWQAFQIFKNQGDCVSFVATKGRNQPSN